MPVSHVLTLDLPVKPACAVSAAASVSWTTSSASVGVAQLQPRDAQQIAAVRVEFGGETSGVHRVVWRG